LIFSWPAVSNFSWFFLIRSRPASRGDDNNNINNRRHIFHCCHWCDKEKRRISLGSNYYRGAPGISNRSKPQPVAEWEPHHLFKKLMTWSTLPPPVLPFLRPNQIEDEIYKVLLLLWRGCVCPCSSSSSKIQRVRNAEWIAN
jgi:hypothetical protein